MAMIDSASLMTLGLGGDRRGNMIRQKSVPSFRSNQDFTCGRADYTIKGTGSHLKPVKDKVRAAVKERRLRLEEFFQPYDRFRNKKVSEAAFVRAMDTTRIALTRDELGLLVNRYRVPGTSDEIDYQRFCDQSNKVFTFKGLERTPAKHIVRSLEYTAPAILGEANPALTPLERARTADMMEEMRRNVKNARLVVKNLFNQYDLHTTGCVSGEQFLRVVSCHGLLSADKVLEMERYGHVLVKAFTVRNDGPGLEASVVNYKALHHQLMVEDQWENRTIEPKPALLVDSYPEEYAFSDGSESREERLERLLVEEAVARRLQVNDFFQDNIGSSMGGTQQLVSGSASLSSRASFTQLLRRLWRTHFTDEESSMLADRYPPPAGQHAARTSGMVDVAEFARCICKRVSSAKKRASDAGRMGTRPGGGGVVNHIRLSATELKDVENVISDMRGKIARERMSLKPAFKNFDPLNELVVANSQFCRVLATQGLLPTDARLRELLTRRYAVCDFRRQTTVHQGFVAYLEFLDDVDAPIGTETKAYIDNFVFGRDQEPDCTRGPRSKCDNGLDRRHADQSCTGHELERADAAILKSAASLTSDALMGRGGIGCNPARDCDAVIRDVRIRTARERVRMVDLFEDFDRLQHGTCTQAQLARVMKTLDHALTDGELAAVCQRYRSCASGQCSAGDGSPLVMYRKLVSDIEAVFTVKGLEKKPARTNVTQVLREARGTERRLRGESSRVEELTGEEEQMLVKFLRELAMKVNKESLSLPSLFVDYDRFNVGDITEAAMERALGGACLLPPEPVFRAMVKKFREHSRCSSGGEINYRAFLSAVELAQDPLRTPRDVPNATKFRAVRADGHADNLVPVPVVTSSSHDEGLTPRTQGTALRSTLLSIGAQLGRSRCELEDFLSREDMHKTGEVGCTAMTHCLVLAGIHLTSQQLAALKSAFRSTTRPETVAWKDLCRAAVEASQGTPHAGKGATPSDAQDGPEANAIIPSTWKEEELMLKIDAEVKARNPNFEALFKVCDRSNHGTVTEAQFFSLLNQGLPRIHFTAADIEILAHLFVDRTGYDFGGQVRYKKFIGAIER